ncbi:hypothetical protein SI65_02790 [Aspergillus cristatus]|uniref:DNA replication regulator Sld3 C-terminal domain-containing protein n=1 Tax=Aspergillus cristatus TaxID=573508 RepID=A0A1E3BNK1_ASPCR|nr:hypothetical protein SI65_02790 [Aspergillus cristatus]
MASRGSPVVLESVNSLSDAYALPPLKKRKTWHPPAKDLGASSIVIRAPATSLSDDRYVLDPITLLPRSRVPFSWLDPSSSTLWPVPSGSLFVADVPILENDLRERVEPTVLAVRSTADGGLYVVERVKKGIYAVSRLGPWVQEGDIFVAVKGWSASAAVADEQTARCQSPVADGTVEWWEVARVEEPLVDVDALSGKGARLDICVAFLDQEEDNVLPVESVESQTASITAPNLERSSSTGARMPSIAINDTQEQLDAMVSVGADDLQSAQELLDGLRDQYLQALYISKTSLAYFAKGPQTRCRNAFQSTEPDSSKTPVDLVNFYREAILPAKKMDLKYKETIPATVRDVMLSVSDDDTAQTKKRKSRKKKKLGKNGLYPDEEDFIRKWWKDRSLSENGVAIETSREEEMKKHVADLRLRETQLQILLILETMALESALPDNKKQDGGNGEDPPDEKSKKSKSKKLQDLNVVLELHLDRLCIWHAVNFDDIAIRESIKDTENNHLSGKKAESDAVRDFCTEVIVPFYASRLPDKCKLITRKFGVSSSTTPAKQSQAKKTPRRESESAAKRQLQQQQQQHLKPRRSLQRVLTDEKSATSQGRYPLQRSKTAPSKPDSRRESMEPLLPMTSANVRGGIQKAKRVENREVDLNAQARQHETKLKKVQLLADQKKELDAAINALRRPNRELVAKDIAEDADKRTASSGGGGSSRKQKNPVRNPLGQGVQVMATPKGNRKRDATFDLPPPPLPINMVRSFPGHSNERSPPPDESDAQMVPGSTVRPNSFSTASGRDMGAIQETPTRRPTKPFESPCFSKSKSTTYTSNTLFRVPNRPSSTQPTEMAPSTPVSSRRIPIAQPQFNSSITETPPRIQQQTTVPIPTPTIAEPAAAPPSAVLSTPVKKGSVQETPVKKNSLAPGDSSTVPVTPEKSIYEQLGWNEEDLGF